MDAAAAATRDAAPVVVGYDGSAGSAIAVEWAAAAAAREDRDLVVLHAVDLTFTPLPPVAEAESLPPTVRTASQNVVDDGVRLATKVLPDARVHSRLTVGTPAGRLVGASRDAAYVVTGSRRHAASLSGVVGSVAYAASAHAHGPSVVVRTNPWDTGREPAVPPQPDRRHKVVVGIDDSAAAQRALDRAAAVADGAGAVLQIVSVTPPDEEALLARADDRRARVVHALRRHVGERVSAAVDHVAAARPDLDIETTVLHGAPSHVLAAEAECAGLVVVGRRGHGGFTGLLLGSVVHRLLHEAMCPVMVVP
jgi:nucleotide-binding universal stress UspA family protein